MQDIPYARFLQIGAELKGHELTMVLPFRDEIVGNPRLPAIHGGVIGAFLEVTATVQLVWEVADIKLPKPIDMNIAFLRSGRPQPTYARATITKQGRRIVQVSADAWQEERNKPIATWQGHFLTKSEIATV
ncbi:MAG: PaaI family thioesterase [Pseudomonadota bacterium]